MGGFLEQPGQHSHAQVAGDEKYHFGQNHIDSRYFAVACDHPGERVAADTAEQHCGHNGTDRSGLHYHTFPPSYNGGGSGHNYN